MPADRRPILLWFRRDLRLADHPALHGACATGRPVVPVFLCDEGVETLGAAPRMRLGMGVAALAHRLEGQGSRLVLRRGPARPTLGALLAETGAGAVWWTRLHDPLARRRDRDVADALRAVRSRDPGEPLPAPARIPAPDSWPRSERLEDWRLDAAMSRGAPVVAAWQRPGETAARERLDRFLAERIGAYAEARDRLDRDGSSRLSENLTLGEISVRACWHAALRSREQGEAGAEPFLRELAWRDFAHHLLFDSPRIATEAWKPGWESFPWSNDEGSPLVRAWQRGRTGIPVVDAAMREMYVTGRMHNRARMIAASFLTKHLLADWRLGLRWFADCLTDWDPASNAVNWQWVAGSGPDAAPFFRIFNPATQARTHDPEGAYVRAWVAEGQADPPATALSFFDAAPPSWGLSPHDPYPVPVIDLAQGREAALAAFRSRRSPWGPGTEPGA